MVIKHKPGHLMEKYNKSSTLKPLKVNDKLFCISNTNFVFFLVFVVHCYFAFFIGFYNCKDGKQLFITIITALCRKCSKDAEGRASILSTDWHYPLNLRVKFIVQTVHFEADSYHQSISGVHFKVQYFHQCTYSMYAVV